MISLPKPSQYPKKVHLKGETYKLVFVKGLKDYGNTDANKKLIRIRAGMSKAETFKTVIHELLHFIEFEWPINIKHKTIYKLEEAIFSLLIDNFL